MTAHIERVSAQRTDRHTVTGGKRYFGSWEVADDTHPGIKLGSDSSPIKLHRSFEQALDHAKGEAMAACRKLDAMTAAGQAAEQQEQ